MRRTPLTRHTPLRGTAAWRDAALTRRTGLRPRSTKQAGRDAAYRVLRAVFLAQRPVCERCDQARATDIQHKAGRVGDDLLDTDTWAALCRECHTWVESHRVEAREQGWAITRLGQRDDTSGDAA